MGRIGENPGNEVEYHPNCSKNPALIIIKTIILAENDDLHVCDTILQIGYLLVTTVLSENFSVTVPKCPYRDKYHKTS